MVLSDRRRAFSLHGEVSERFNGPMLFRGAKFLLGCVIGLALVAGCNRQPASSEGKTSDVISVTKEKAEKGEADAQFRLGVMFANEDGVPLSPTEAVEWYRKAAEQGHLKAQIQLAECYLSGTGVAVDPAKAARWYLSAAETGDPVSQNRMGAMNDLGLGVPQDSLEAAVWYRRAADQGLAEAQSNLGVLYASGRGVPSDLVEAFKWLSLADAQGYQRNAAYLTETSTQMTAAQLSEAKQRVANFRKRK